MARYFFNVLNQHSGLDVVGEELPNNEAAWREATMIAGELFKDIDGKFKPGQVVVRGDGRAPQSNLSYQHQR